MKSFGQILMIIGTIWALVAFNMDTTVETESLSIGSTYYPSKKVHNIGKMDERRNHLMLSALAIIAGVILFAVGSKQTTEKISAAEGARLCPFCAEQVKKEAKICKHCGRDIEIQLNAIDKNSLTNEIKDAICNNDITKVKKILTSGIVLDVDNHESLNLLDYADLYNRKEILELLQVHKSSSRVT